jgi:hypothetical protein
LVPVRSLLVLRDSAPGACLVDYEGAGPVAGWPCALGCGEDAHRWTCRLRVILGSPARLADLYGHALPGTLRAGSIRFLLCLKSLMTRKDCRDASLPLSRDG